MAESGNHITRGPKDRNRVDVDQEWECIWWSKGWGVSVAALKAAVKEVGPLVTDLDRHLTSESPH
jgi:hypothetical protein